MEFVIVGEADCDAEFGYGQLGKSKLQVDPMVLPSSTMHFGGSC